jgi:uncharacterized membrane-anchored protein YhcB (DUF1043 family)
LEDLRNEKDSKIKILQDELDKITHRVKDYEQHVKGELAMKEVLESRQNHYIELLKKEVTVAKKILGNPKLRDRIIRDLNFE